MAQCQADVKKHGSARFDLYGGIFSPQVYGATIGNGHVERMPSFRRAADYSNVIRAENSLQENLACDGFREENGMKAAAGGGLKFSGDLPMGAYGGYGVNYSNGMDRRKSTKGMMGQSPVLTTPEASPVQSSKGGGIQSGANIRNLPNTNEPSGTPPFTCKSSGELSANDRILVKGIHPDTFGEIIKGVGNLCDDLDRRSGGLKSGDLDSGSGSTKGRSQRAESPNSIGSSSSDGNPNVGMIVNFGSILLSGGTVKSGPIFPTTNPAAAPSFSGTVKSGPILPTTNPAAAPAFSGRGVHNNGHAPIPVPTSGSLKDGRRSNSLDYTAGTQKAAHARSRSDSASGGAYTGANNVGVSPRSPLSTSPSGSAYGSPHRADSGSLNRSGGVLSESLAIRNALASMDPEVAKNVGNDQYKKGYFAEALNLYDKAISLAPEEAPYRSNRAAALTGLGRLPEAVQECLQAIRLDPSFSRAHHRLGTLYLRGEHKQAAAAAFIEAMRCMPAASAELFCSKMRTNYGLGQVDNATRHFRAAGSQTEWADTQRSLAIEKHLWKCKDARKAQDWPAVIRETDASIIAGADCSSMVMAYKAEALLKLHKPEEADSVMSNALRFEDSLKRTSLTQTHSTVLLIQAHVDMALGRFDNAVAAAEKASQLTPNDLAVTILLGKAKTVAKARKVGNDLFKAGKFSEAVVAYGEGLESAPKNAVLLCNRAACRAKLCQWEKAVEDSNSALEEQPNYTKALLRRAQSYAKLERWEDALRDYELLRREVPGDAEVARALFDVKVSLKQSKGEDTHKIRRFGGDVVEITAYDQYQEAVTAPGLAVVQFSTRWSERCREMMPFVEDLCKRHLSITFIKVDVNDQPYLSKSESVNFVPTFKLYKNGSKLKELAGPTYEDLELAINPLSS